MISTAPSVFDRNYRPYGTEQPGSGIQDYKYTGKPQDTATGLYYFGARYYDPDIGRFLSRDVAQHGLEDPQLFNRYVYARNNPLKYNDPNGEFPVHILAGAVIGAAVAVAYYSLENWGWWESSEGTTGAMIAVASGAFTGALVATIGPVGAYLGGGPYASIIGKVVPGALSAAAGRSFEGILSFAAGGELASPQEVGISATGGGVAGMVGPRVVNVIKKLAKVASVPTGPTVDASPEARAGLTQVLKDIAETISDTGVQRVFENFVEAMTGGDASVSEYSAAEAELHQTVFSTPYWGEKYPWAYSLLPY